MRLAGTWKQYSAKAMSQLMRMTLKSGACRYFRWPYHAKVMKMLERVRSRIVVMPICCLIPGFVCTLVSYQGIACAIRDQHHLEAAFAAVLASSLKRRPDTESLMPRGPLAARFRDRLANGQ